MSKNLNKVYTKLLKNDLGEISYNWFPLGLLPEEDVEFINDAINSGDYARFIAIREILAVVYPGNDILPEFGLDKNGEMISILNPIHFVKITSNNVDHSMDWFAPFCC